MYRLCFPLKRPLGPIPGSTAAVAPLSLYGAARAKDYSGKMGEPASGGRGRLARSAGGTLMQRFNRHDRRGIPPSIQYILGGKPTVVIG